jgi:hypothetical protein
VQLLLQTEREAWAAEMQVIEHRSGKLVSDKDELIA